MSPWPCCPAELLVAFDDLHYQTPGTGAGTTPGAPTPAASSSGAASGRGGTRHSSAQSAPFRPAVVVIGITSQACSVDDVVARCFVAPPGNPTAGAAGTGAVPRASGAAVYVSLPTPDTREEVIFYEMCKHSAALDVEDVEKLVK